jgi:tripartite-type tricarboxylate transporter receptor subunit TctC
VKGKFLICALAILGSFGSATAQVYPSRPITVVVPFAAGGPTDTLARTLADRMRVTLGQPVLIENVTGAGGSIGVGRVVRAAPDGYTIGIGNWSTHVINGAIYPLAYGLLSDLEPIALLPSSPQLIVANNAMPAKDLGALITWLKTNKASAGTAGAGSASHVGGLYFQSFTGTHLSFVPYRGTGPALQDLIAGQIDLMFDQSSNSLPHVREGKIKAYAVTSKSRLASAPDIPTVDEAGLAGFYISVWHGLWAPKGTSKDVVATLATAVGDALVHPTIAKRLGSLGQEIAGQSPQPQQALAKLQKAEIEKWWPIIKASNVRGE